MFVNRYTLLCGAIVTHICLFVFLFTASWYDYVFLLLIYTLMRCCGISMLFHRYYAHPTWNPPQWFLWIGTAFGCLSHEGTPISWTAWHLTHHKHSDTERDPHSPLYHNKFFCWFLVMFSDINLKYGIKLRKDPIAVFFHRWFWAVHLVYAVGIFLVYPYGIISLYLAPAGLTWAGGAIQNIYSHLLGAQPNNTGDNSRNNWFNVIAGFGEGWHNNHHANPGQYRFGPFDPAARLIEWLDPSKKH